MNPWDMWKKSFDAWEQTTAKYFEQVMQNPAVLGPAGTLLTAFMKTKAATDRAVAQGWAAIGLIVQFRGPAIEVPITSTNSTTNGLRWTNRPITRGMTNASSIWRSAK